MRQELTEAVQSVASSLTFGRLFAFGSSASGLHQQGSDLDLTLVFEPPGAALPVSSQLTMSHEGQQARATLPHRQPLRTATLPHWRPLRRSSRAR